MTRSDSGAAARDTKAWHDLQRVVDDALDLPDEKREAFVRAACGDDALLFERARRLVRACALAESGDGLLDAPAALFGAPLFADLAAREGAAEARRRTALTEALRAALAGRYDVRRELGRGGMATVYVADDLRHERAVAVKMLDPRAVPAAGVARFLSEIRTAARLTHPHVLGLHDSGEAGGLLYFVMPYVEGETLRARLRREGALPVVDALRLLREMADALAYAHAQGVVHRDLKPENVLLSGGHAVVADFGIAKALADVTDRGEEGPGDVLTAAGATVGTFGYMSPEQARGDVAIDHRADLYALGVVAYELLAGAHPFGVRVPAAYIVAQLTETPAPLERVRPEVPPAVAGLVRHLMATDRTERPDGAARVVEILDSALAVVPSMPRLLRWVASLAAALAVGAGFGAWRTRPPPAADWRAAQHATPAAAPAGPSVAVLPFVNDLHDEATDYFADGITDELAADLARTPGLRVAARRSAYAFRGSVSRARDIADSLGVSMLLDGTVRREKDRVRVTAQLTRAADGYVLWSDKFEGDARNVFAVQDTITGAIAGALRLTLGAGNAASASARTRSLEAHDLYLEGHFEASKHTQAGLLAALTLYRRAAASDSDFALPWVGIADAYGWLADDYYPAHDAYPMAKAAAMRAVRLAPALADAHAVLGWILLAYDWDYAAAERELREAVALDSTSALAHSNYAYALLYRRQPALALAEMRRAMALDPLSAALSANLEWHLLMQGRYRDVVAQHDTTRRLGPAYYFGDLWAGVAYRELGRNADALALYRAAEAAQGGRPLYGTAVTLARMGDSAGARAELERILAPASRVHVRPEAVAQVYVALGDRDRAFAWLERAFISRSNGLQEIAFSPVYAPLRDDPRFDTLLRRVGLR